MPDLLPMTMSGLAELPSASAAFTRRQAAIPGIGTFLVIHSRPGVPRGLRLWFGPLFTFGGANE
jgi:hypothetical protein